MDVVEYFTEAGFPEQATAFQEQVSSQPGPTGVCTHRGPHGCSLTLPVSVLPRKLMASLCCSCNGQMCSLAYPFAWAQP